jgi:hypothetical protein
MANFKAPTKTNPKEDVFIMHELTVEVLSNWFNNYPADHRQIRAFKYLQEANELLYLACIDLDAIQVDCSKF